MLAGTRVDKLMAPIDPAVFVVCSSRDEVRQNRDPTSGAGADRNGIDSAELIAEAERVKRLARALLKDLYAADFSVAAIGDHHFAGHPLVLVHQEDRLRELIDVAERFVQLFNAVVNRKDSLVQVLRSCQYRRGVTVRREKQSIAML